MSTLLYTLGHRIARHRWKVLVAWCLLASAAFAVAGLAGGQLVNDYTIPGTESQRGIDTLAQRFPQASGTTGQVVFTSSSGPIIDQQAAVNQQIQAISKVQHVSSVDDPFASDAVGTISPDKLNAMSSIQFDVPATSLPPEAMTQVEAAAQPPPGAAFTVTLGGAMYPPTGVGIGITELSLNEVLPLPQFVAGASRFLLGGGGDVVSPCLVLIGWTVFALLVSVAFTARRRPELAGVARPPSSAGVSTLSLAAEGA
jgi:RND superfamily putative drug exporter